MPKIESEAKYSEDDPSLPTLHNLNSPYYVELERSNDYLSFPAGPATSRNGLQDISIKSALADADVSQHVETDTSSQRALKEATSKQTRGEASKQCTKVSATNRSLGSTSASRRHSYQP